MTFPSLILNSDIAKRNIKKMAHKASDLNVEFRPHFKTHQSLEIGTWFRDEGVKGITVSSVKMAEFFSKDLWKDITIAFPVSKLDVHRLNKLCSTATVNILAVDSITLKDFDEKLTNKLGIYIELDPGYGRSGIPILNFSILEDLKSEIVNSKHLTFKGFYTHAGHSYKCRSRQEIQDLVEPILDQLNELKDHFHDPICFGDTPSCSVLDHFGPIDQISPGNLVFYDWTQTKINSCSEENIAVAMYCPVVAKYSQRNQLLIHGGAVHFSKDSFADSAGNPYFGMVAQKNKGGWGSSLPGNTLSSISQEHGTITCTPEYFDQVNVGDIIPILPIHSCLTADLMGEYHTIDGDSFDHMSMKAF